MKKMKFTIITVTYNNLYGLQKTQKSIQNQSFRDFEWIVVDGNSTDGSKSFLKHQNATVISEPDDGIYDAMNKGKNKAKGDYLLFLNAGDSLASPYILETVEQEIKTVQHSPTLIYGDSYEDQQLKTAKNHKRIEQGLFTHHQAIFYAREKTLNLNYDTNYKIAADYKFTASILLKKNQDVLYIPLPICIFESGGISQKNAYLGRKEQYKIRQELNICSVPINILIYAAQTLIWQLHLYLPNLYWHLKSSCNNHRDS